MPENKQIPTSDSILNIPLIESEIKVKNAIEACELIIGNNLLHTIKITGLGLTYIIGKDMSYEISNDELADLQNLVDYLYSVANSAPFELVFLDSIDILNGGGFRGVPATSLGNLTLGDYTFIGSGFSNTIGNTAPGSCGAHFGFIGGGTNNCIDTGTSSGYDTVYGFIGGGYDNIICAGACHSSIVGGEGNKVVHKWATVSGCNVNSAFDCAFHTNQIAVPNTQLYTGLGGGLIQYFPTPVWMVACGFPAFSCNALIN